MGISINTVKIANASLAENLLMLIIIKCHLKKLLLASLIFV